MVIIFDQIDAAFVIINKKWGKKTIKLLNGLRNWHYNWHQ